MRKVVICIAFSAVVYGYPACYGQEFTINQLELTPAGVALHYDLLDTARNRFYTVQVFSSRDNFLNPLTKLKGDVGLEVRPGANRKIMWNPVEEFGPAYRGDVELEIRGKLYVPFVRFTNLEDYKNIKRAKPTTLTWTGGTRQNILNFNLYKGEELVTVISNVANSGSYDMVLPGSVKPGEGYYFIVVDSKNKDQMMKTSEFVVKRKVNLVTKIVAGLAFAGGVYFLLPEPEPEPIDGPSGPPSSKN
jgi:hypothetical protein